MALSNLKSTNPVSCKTFHIAGILTDVYGLEELSPQTISVSCIWLLHPRLQKKEGMATIAHNTINHWNEKQSRDKKIGLIAVAFDSRNHGTREVKSEANGSWKEGNETHAQDMFSIIHGTVLDTSLLIDHLESYIFRSQDSPSIHEHLVLGVSLGGHGAWQALFNEPRVTAAIAIIGCPDYLELLRDRANRLKRTSYTTDNGQTFANSTDFPPALVTSLSTIDPKALLFKTTPIPSNTSTLSPPLKAHLKSVLASRVTNKRVLVQSGGVDRLVPYLCSKPFLDFLKGVTGEGGWYEGGDERGGDLRIDDRVYKGVGHRFTDEMLSEAIEWIEEVIGRSDRGLSPVWEKNTSPRLLPNGAHL